MAQSELTKTYRLAIRMVLAGFLMLIGAIAAFAAKAAALGWTFLVLMLAFGGAGFVCALRFRNRAVALAREARAEQKARLEESFRSGPPHAGP
jgi:uncharacterized membrane-anchored protein